MKKSFLRALSDNKSKLFTEKPLKNTLDFGVFFGDFLVNHLDLLSLRARKNDFINEIMLEMCSATSNYLWGTIS